MTDRTFAPDWTEAECEAWKLAYAAGEPVIMPMLEHEPETCPHCDFLRKLMEESYE